LNFLNFSQDFFRLRQFYFIAKAGSLSGAARALDASHTGLSKSLSILEHRLKTKLFIRKARGMQLTTDGEKLFEHTVRNFQDNDAFFKAFLDKGDEVQGEIQILTTPAVGETELTGFLLNFLEKYPKLTSTKIITQTTDFDIQGSDIAIRTAIPNRPDLEQLPLRTFHMKLWASEEYLQKFGTPKDPQELDAHRLLVFSENKHNIYYNTNWIHWLLYIGNGTDQARKPFYQINSTEGLHNAAVNGYGIALLAEEYVKIKGSRLVEVLPHIEPQKVDVSFICAKKYANFKRVKALYEYLYDRYNTDL
jgi:DNA-binding transcriptional LysR family regulator